MNSERAPGWTEGKNDAQRKFNLEKARKMLISKGRVTLGSKKTKLETSEINLQFLPL